MSLFDSAWSQLGAVGLLAVFVLAILTGRLVPRSIAKDLVQRADANAERSQAAAVASDQRADETVRLLTEMVSAMRSVEALVRDQRGDLRRAPGADAA
jgi:hypothetical protein